MYVDDEHFKGVVVFSETTRYDTVAFAKTAHPLWIALSL